MWNVILHGKISAYCWGVFSQIIVICQNIKDLLPSSAASYDVRIVDNYFLFGYVAHTYMDKTTTYFLPLLLHTHIFLPFSGNILCLYKVSAADCYDCLAWMLVVIIEIWTTLKCIVHIYTCLCNSCWSLRSLPILHLFLDISLECTCPFIHAIINVLSKLPTYLKYIKILC